MLYIIFTSFHVLYNGYLINIYVQSDIQSARLQLSKNNT